MNKGNTEALCRDFPMLYRDVGKDPHETCMTWGFECGDGWYGIIRELSQKLTDHAKATGIDILALQVKEKFGTLRFYTSMTSDGPAKEGAYAAAWDMIDEAEKKSETTCEDCGAPGRLVPGGWLRTLCEDCEDSK